MLAVYLTSQSFQEWNDEPVLTTLKNTALPIDKVSHVQRLFKSTCGVYCNTMFHVAEAKIIRHINMVLHVETLAHFSVPKRKSVGKIWGKYG